MVHLFLFAQGAGVQCLTQSHKVYQDKGNAYK